MAPTMQLNFVYLNSYGDIVYPQYILLISSFLVKVSLCYVFSLSQILTTYINESWDSNFAI